MPNHVYSRHSSAPNCANYFVISADNLSCANQLRLLRLRRHRKARAFAQWITTPVAETRGTRLVQRGLSFGESILYVPRQPTNISAAETRRSWHLGILKFKLRAILRGFGWL